MPNIEERIESGISIVIKDLGYNLYDVQYVKEGKDYFLRIFIENPKGEITLDDCERVNNAITDILDEKDYIKEQYFLEVSSTGVEKIIRKDKHLKENLGEYITVKMFKPLDKEKELVGILKEFNDESIIIQVENEPIEISRKNIAQIKKYFDWDN